MSSRRSPQRGVAMGAVALSWLAERSQRSRRSRARSPSSFETLGFVEQSETRCGASTWRTPGSGLVARIGRLDVSPVPHVFGWTLDEHETSTTTRRRPSRDSYPPRASGLSPGASEEILGEGAARQTATRSCWRRRSATFRANVGLSTRFGAVRSRCGGCERPLDLYYGAMTRHASRRHCRPTAFDALVDSVVVEVGLLSTTAPSGSRACDREREGTTDRGAATAYNLRRGDYGVLRAICAEVPRDGRRSGRRERASRVVRSASAARCSAGRSRRSTRSRERAARGGLGRAGVAREPSDGRWRRSRARARWAARRAAAARCASSRRAAGARRRVRELDSGVAARVIDSRSRRTSRRVRRLRDLRPGARRLAFVVLRAVRAPAPRPGVGRHRRQRRRRPHHDAARPGPRQPGLHRARPAHARRRLRDRSRPLLDDRVERLGELAAGPSLRGGREIALAHNGNLVNAVELHAELRGAASRSARRRTRRSSPRCSRRTRATRSRTRSPR